MSVQPVSPPPPPHGGPDSEKKSSGIPWWVWVIIAGACCFIAVPILAVVAAIAIPNMVTARQGANEAAAIGALRTLTTAQALFRDGDKDKDQVPDYAGDLSELQGSGLIEGVLGSGTKQGYLFRIEGADEMRWSGTATPQLPGRSGGRSFFADESGIIRWRPAERGRARSDDPPIGG